LVFIFRRKLFQKSFENVFECVRKEKGKKKEIVFAALGRKPSFPAPFSSPLAQPRPLSLSAVGRVAGRPKLLMSQAAAPSSPFLWLTRRARV
jgi:hypothetical protein